MNNNLVLIGFMGVGKSSVARRLAKDLDMVGVDTDDLIETMEGRKIKSIFKQSGEEYFRNSEKKVALWLEHSVKNCVISTGGGFFIVGNLQKIGTVIYLRSSFEDIMDRINRHPNSKQKLQKRPLLIDTKKAEELFSQREPKYLECSDVIIDMYKHKTVKGVVKDILSQLTKQGIKRV